MFSLSTGFYQSYLFANAEVYFPQLPLAMKKLLFISLSENHNSEENSVKEGGEGEALRDTM